MVPEASTRSATTKQLRISLRLCINPRLKLSSYLRERERHWSDLEQLVGRPPVLLPTLRIPAFTFAFPFLSTLRSNLICPGALVYLFSGVEMKICSTTMNGFFWRISYGSLFFFVLCIYLPTAISDSIFANPTFYLVGCDIEYLATHVGCGI